MPRRVLSASPGDPVRLGVADVAGNDTGPISPAARVDDRPQVTLGSSHRVVPPTEREGPAVKIYLVAPRNPESFWTFDRILPSLGKRCVFPNLSLPTVAGLTPREHEVVLCDENVEDVDFDTDADVVGLT